MEWNKNFEQVEARENSKKSGRVLLGTNWNKLGKKRHADVSRLRFGTITKISNLHFRL